jgi:hypothetical protein
VLPAIMVYCCFLFNVLFGEKAAQIIHSNNDNNAQANIGTIIQDKAHIDSLKEEINFLRKILEKKD